jgi:anion-transporting  ArsA/GET3 family ATPase
MVRDLFRDADTTEFVIATIPTTLAVRESSRLLRSLRKEDIPCKHIIVNQVQAGRQPGRQADRKQRSLNLLLANAWQVI